MNSNERKKEKKKEQSSSLLQGMLVCLVVCVVPLVYWVWFVVWNDQVLSRDTSDWASFGDFFGGAVGPIVGFATIILLIQTLDLQRRGLKEQREHFEESNKAADEQIRIMNIQAFEQSFFGLLRDYKQHVSGITFPETNPRAKLRRGHKVLDEDLSKGLEAISKMVHFFFANCNEVMVSRKDGRNLQIKNRLISGWDQMYEKQGEGVRTSLRVLFSILNWIDEHNVLNTSEKYHYANILRAQLSDYELILIYIYGFTPEGNYIIDDVDRYALFNNLEVRLYPVLLEIYNDERPEPYSSTAFNETQAIEVYGSH